VDAESIEYSISTTGIWDYSDWQSARKIIDGKEINCSVTPTLSEGSENYIRWRAKDLLGNGYHISENYQIHVELNNPPMTMLLTPVNKSILKILSPELTWTGYDPDNDSELSYFILLSQNLEDIISLNSSAIIKTLINETTFRIDIPLEDNKTYYWTAIPNDGIDNGTCTSSYYQFKIDTKIELPIVKLLEPIDNSNVTTNTPKLSWELTYSEPSQVTFDIYYKQAIESSNFISKKHLYKNNYKLTTFIFDIPLTHGETYYWTVIPNVNLPDGKLEGICSSGIWSFKVELQKESVFALNLGIATQKLSIDQGNYSSTNISVINRGNIVDTIFVYVDKGILDANVALERANTPIKLNVSEVIMLKLEIFVSEDAKPQNYTISVTAMSNGAALERKDVSVTKTFRLQVIEKAREPINGEELPPEEKGEEIDYLIWSIIIILIILFVSLFLYVYKSRRIPYVKSEILSEPPEHLALPKVTGKPIEIKGLFGAGETGDSELGLTTPIKGAITLNGKTVPAEFQLPKAIFTKDQELKLLREKFLLGDISEETYNKLRTEIESSEDIDITGLEGTEPESEEELLDEIPEDEQEPIIEEPDLGIEEEIPVDVEKSEELDEEKRLPSIDSEIPAEIPVDEEKDKIPEIKSKKKAKKRNRKEEKEKAEGPVEEPVAEDEFHDEQEEVHSFPEDELCITCGQGLDPDMAYCWSCGTKYKKKE
jgi:hypothetical protein